MLTILNSKAVKLLRQQLLEEYGYAGRPDLVFMLNEKKEKVSVFSKDLAKLGTAGLRIDTMGLYFGAHYKGRFRLTIEGTQIIGPECTKNVVSITKGEMQRWLLGEDLPIEEIPPNADPGAFVILRCGDDYLGCGKLTAEKILNYVPKARYVHALYGE